MARRSLGWVQNASDIDNLKKVVKLFVKGSDVNNELKNEKLPKLIEDEKEKEKFINFLNADKIEIDYFSLKGKGASGGKRKDALCSGIVQAVMKNQSGREYVDDWTSDCYIRWAISLGFIYYNAKNDSCKITDLGHNYATSENGSQLEEELLLYAFLSYPPIIRVLKLLKDKKHLTKFEIGAKLGFIKESGFTTIPQKIFIQEYENETNKEKKKKHKI